MDPLIVAKDDEPTGELLSGPVGVRCTNCKAPIASDQRYCINCGERRGKARFSFAELAATSAAQAPDAAPPKPPRGQRASSGATLVAGIATLLLAMGVGVLIGHANNNNGPARAAAPAQIITVGGGGVAAATPNSAISPSTTKGKVTKTKAPVIHLTKKTTQAAAAAASKVLGAGAPKNPTVQPGGACSGGAGCQGGKFTGNFFH